MDVIHRVGLGWDIFFGGAGGAVVCDFICHVLCWYEYWFDVFVFDMCDVGGGNNGSCG